MKSILLLICMLTPLLTGCDSAADRSAAAPTSDEQVQQESISFSINPAKSVAYLGKDYVHVFLQGNNSVTSIKFDLPNSTTEVFQVRLGKGNANSNTLTHYSGSDIARYILPQGPHIPIPDSIEYKQQRSLGGLLICENAPVKGRFQYGRQIVISLEQVDLSDGKRYALQPIALTLNPFPP